MAAKRRTKDKPAEQEDRVRIERFKENLPVTLTREQVEERSQRSAHLVQDCDHIEEALKAYTKTEKSRIATVQSEIRHLSSEVRSKTTYQDVPCERRYNFTTGRVSEVRIDTGEVISERDMNDAERQRDLFDGTGGSGDIDSEFSDAPVDDKGEEKAAE
jgi:hypothetical protein